MREEQWLAPYEAPKDMITLHPEGDDGNGSSEDDEGSSDDDGDAELHGWDSATKKSVSCDVCFWCSFVGFLRTNKGRKYVSKNNNNSNNNDNNNEIETV
jgi:hypothetical protein